MRRRAIQFGLMLLLGAAPRLAHAQSATSRPSLETMFDNVEFRRGLKKRGLESLLDYYDRHYTPGQGPEAKLLERDRLLALADDPATPPDRRAAAIVQSIQLLHEAIEQTTDVPNRWTLLLDLGRDLLYRQGEPHYNSIQYQGYNSQDADKLRAIAVSAQDAFRRLDEEITQYVARLDNLTPAEFRKLERRGIIGATDRLSGQAQYFLQWARYYEALARGPADRRAEGLLRDVVTYLRHPDHDYTSQPHAETGVQAQALLLAGMSYRLLGDAQKCGEALKEAARVVAALPETESAGLRWVYIQAQLELARLSRDLGQYVFARGWVTQLREWREKNMPDNFSLALTLALLDGEIMRDQAQSLRRAGQPTEADQVDARRYAGLMQLLESHPARRSDVFRALDRLIDPDLPDARLNAVELNARLAGLLAEATSRRTSPGADAAGAEQADALLRRAVQVGESAVAAEGEWGGRLRPIALFNTAVAEYQLGRRTDAVRHFVQLARAYPDFDQSAQALDYAVTIAADAYRQDARRVDPAAAEMFILAVTALAELQPGSPQTAYWRFFLAEALARQGRLEEALEYFAAVPPSDERYPDAVYLHGLRLWDLFRRERESGAADDALMRRLLAVVDAARRSERVQEEAAARTRDAARRAELEAYRAAARLLAAEALAQPELAQPEQALALLADFERHFADAPALFGRVLRLRILALQGLGRFDEAAQVVDDCLQRDPDNAGSIMDELLVVMTRDLREMAAAGRTDPDRAAQALALAAKLHDWAETHPQWVEQHGRASFEVRLGQAYLAAGDAQRALEVLQRCAERDATGRPDGRSNNTEALLGVGEALYQLKRYEQAQHVFFDLWQRLPEGSDPWWTALLRSLEVHTQLETDPSRILGEVRKQRFLRPGLGGPALQRRFELLERRNEARLREATAAR